jgi:hypothetical protein
MPTQQPDNRAGLVLAWSDPSGDKLTVFCTFAQVLDVNPDLVVTLNESLTWARDGATTS